MKKYIDVNTLSCKLINKDVAKKMIIKYHYTHAWTSCRYAFGLYKKSNHSFFDSHDELVGVATYGHPIGRLAAQSISDELNPSNVLELTRLFIHDTCGTNAESYFMGQTFKWFKENKEQVDVLMSYSDPKVGHLGGIYQATNWLYQGDSMRMVDAYSVRLEEDSEWLHSRTVFSRWGSNNLDILKKKIGKTFWVREEPRKHRYLYLLCNKKHKKNIMKTLKHPILPYPKNKKEINLKVEEINV